MLDRRNILDGKRNYLFGCVVLLTICVISVAFSTINRDDFAAARREILIRKVGHELLLQSGDSISRVLPVKRISENEYQISFENKLTFLPDSLINTTQRLLAKDQLNGDYVVKVLNTDNSSVVYGYAISKNKKDDIVACIGRKQPKAAYIVSLKFKPQGITTAKNGYLLGSLPFLAFVGFIFLRSAKPRKSSAEVQYTSTITLGSVIFSAKDRTLLIDGNTIELTGTESRVLHIFATSPNETIERSRLQKEIWEDEGVIVGRSLDMFISKLRKRLESDPNIKINVVRGKGYKLEIGS
ncbi:MAG: winged helix family transcriptional regulator [Pedobacter sp.]|nr:MAG: winged helix family transcriptional regulator [Pedobacter sp.]